MEDKDDELRESLPEMLLRLKGALCSCSDRGIGRMETSDKVTDSVEDESVNRYGLALSVLSEGTEDELFGAAKDEYLMLRSSGKSCSELR